MREAGSLRPRPRTLPTQTSIEIGTDRTSTIGTSRRSGGGNTKRRYQMAQSFDYESASASGDTDTSPLERLAEIAARTAEETGKFANVDAILRIPVTMQVVLGSATIPVAKPVDVVVNGRVVARGEVVVVEEDNSRFGVSLTEIVGPLGQGDS